MTGLTLIGNFVLGRRSRYLEAIPRCTYGVCSDCKCTCTCVCVGRGGGDRMLKVCIQIYNYHDVLHVLLPDDETTWTSAGSRSQKGNDRDVKFRNEFF